MNTFILYIFTGALLISNSYYSTYGTMFLIGFCLYCSIKNRSQLTKLNIVASLLLVISYLFSGIKSQSLEPTLLMLLLVNNISLVQISKKQIHKLVTILSILFSILACLQFLKGEFAYGTFFNVFNTKEIYPNAFAALNLLLLPLNKPKYQSLNILNIILSKSRIALVITGIYYLYKLITNKQKYKAGLIIAIAVAIIPLGFINKSNQSAEFNSIDQRIEHWRNTPRLLNNVKAVLVGYGANSFPFIYQRVQRIPENQSPHSHNLILNLLVEYGILFTVILFILLYSKFRKLDKEYKIAIILFLIHNMFDLNIQFPLTVFILLLLIGSTSISINNTRKNTLGISTNVLSLCILLLSLTNNFYFSHKDTLLQDASKASVHEYLKENPLDSNQLLKINEKENIKNVFLSNPFDVNNLYLLLKHYPDTKFNSYWLDNYKRWYLSHTKHNLNYIKEKGTVAKLKEIFINRDPEFANKL